MAKRMNDYGSGKPRTNDKRESGDKRFGKDTRSGRDDRKKQGSFSRDTDKKAVAPKFNKDNDRRDQDTGRRTFSKDGGRDNKRDFGREPERDEDEDINLVEGRNPVLEVLKSGRAIDKLFVQKGAAEGSIRQIIAMAKERNILIKEVDRRKLDMLSSTQGHQGVIASVALYKYYEIDEILQIAKDKNEDPFIIILDEITDNNNLGSILRIADAAGVHGVIIPKRRSATLTPVVAKTSAGAIEYVPVSKVTNLTQTIEYLKKKGLWIVGAEMSGSTYYKKDLTGPIALVIGSEGEGMGRLIKEKCDFLVSIPMTGKISSLNAAVSAGIIVYEVNKQRTAKQVEGSTH